MSRSHSLPQTFTDRLSTIYPHDIQETILSCLASPRKTSFRLNRLLGKREEILNQIAGLGLKIQEVNWYSDAFVIDGDKKLLLDSDIYKHGQIYLQSLSSMLAVLVLDPQENDYILDIAAAPGSKTTMMASFMNNTGTIIANDVSPKRLHKLKLNLHSQGVTNTNILHIPGERIWQKYPEVFDKALVDVPCSMEGRFVASDPKTYEDWTPKKGKILSSKQKHILRSAVSSVKVGGTIVYTTCTLSLEENEMVIDWLLKREGNSIELEEVQFEDVDSLPGLTSYKNKTFHPDLSKTLRILPTETMEGFYIAKIKKLESTI